MRGKSENSEKDNNSSYATSSEILNSIKEISNNFHLEKSGLYWA